MEWTWLCYRLLLSIVVTLLASTAGELCFSRNSNNCNIFVCPESPDSEDEKFCCGTCSETYCCSSAEDRLDINQCFRDPDPQPRQSTDAPRIESDSSPKISYVRAIIVAAAVVTLTSLAIGYTFRHTFCLWWQSLNRKQKTARPLSLHIPDLTDTSSLHDFPTPESIVYIKDLMALLPISEERTVVQLGDGDADFQDKGAESSPSSHSDTVQGTGGPSSIQAHHSSSILLHSDAEVSCGTRSQPPSSTGNNLPSHDVPPNSVEDPNDSLGLDATQPLLTLEDSSEVGSAAQGDPEVQQVDPSDVPPRSSPTASPSIDPEDSPSCNVAASHGLQVLSGASDSPPGEDTHQAIPGARDGAAEMSTVPPSAPPDGAAAGPILDHVVLSQTQDESEGAGSDSTRL